MSPEVVMPDHPLYLQARNAYRDYLKAKERGAPAATVDQLRLIYEAQMKTATHYHMSLPGASGQVSSSGNMQLFSTSGFTPACR